MRFPIRWPRRAPARDRPPAPALPAAAPGELTAVSLWLRPGVDGLDGTDHSADPFEAALLDRHVERAALLLLADGDVRLADERARMRTALVATLPAGAEPLVDAMIFRAVQMRRVLDAAAFDADTGAVVWH